MSDGKEEGQPAESREKTPTEQEKEEHSDEGKRGADAPEEQKEKTDDGAQEEKRTEKEEEKHEQKQKNTASEEGEGDYDYYRYWRVDPEHLSEERQREEPTPEEEGPAAAQEESKNEPEDSQPAQKQEEEKKEDPEPSKDEKKPTSPVEFDYIQYWRMRPQNIAEDQKERKEDEHQADRTEEVKEEPGEQQEEEKKTQEQEKRVVRDRTPVTKPKHVPIGDKVVERPPKEYSPDRARLPSVPKFQTPSPRRTPKKKAPGATPVTLENFEMHNASGGKETILDTHYEQVTLNSPRSLEACRCCGVHPSELQRKPLSLFLLASSARTDLDYQVAMVRYDHFEARRLRTLQMLKTVRQKLIKEEEERVEQRKKAASTPQKGSPRAASRGRSVSPAASVRSAQQSAEKEKKFQEARQRASQLEQYDYNSREQFYYRLRQKEQLAAARREQHLIQKSAHNASPESTVSWEERRLKCRERADELTYLQQAAASAKWEKKEVVLAARRDIQGRSPGGNARRSSTPGNRQSLSRSGSISATSSGRTRSVSPSQHLVEEHARNLHAAALEEARCKSEKMKQKVLEQRLRSEAQRQKEEDRRVNAAHARRLMMHLDLKKRGSSDVIYDIY